MDQLTWLQQSLQKPRLSAIARGLVEIFPRSEVPQIRLDANNTTRGTYNSASKLVADHIEYPGYILRYRALSASSNYVNHGWSRPYTDHIGILGGQVTVANDGFMGGAYILNDEWMAVRSQSFGDRIQFLSGYKQDDGAFREPFPSAFASIVPVQAGLKADTDMGELMDSDGTILLTEPLAFEEPESRGFVSIQWLTQSETQRAQG